MIYIVIGIIVIILFKIIKEIRLANAMNNFLVEVIKSRMIMDKQDSFFLANCYLDQAEDTYLQFDKGRDGFTINCCHKRGSREDS